MRVGAFGDQDLLQQPDLFEPAGRAQYRRAPGHPQTDTQRRLRGPVPRHIADHRVHRAVGGLHHVVEVTAEQGVRPARRVPGHRFEGVVVQQGHGQQPAFEAGVLPRHQPVGAQRRRGLLDLLALEGVTDRAAQRLRIEPSLDEVVLGAGRHGRQARIGLGPARQHHDGRIRRRLDDPGHGVQAVHIGQMQIEQYAARGPAAGQEPARLRERPAPGQRGIQLAVREHLLDEEGVTGVVLDQQDHGVDLPHRTMAGFAAGLVAGAVLARGLVAGRRGPVLYGDGVRAQGDAGGRAARRELGHCPPPCTDRTAQPRPYRREAYVTEPWRSRRGVAAPLHARQREGHHTNGAASRAWQT